MNKTPEYGANLTPSEPNTAAWNPLSIALIGALLNFWPAGILYALNYERLGAPQLKQPRLIQYSLLGVIMLMLVVMATLSSPQRPAFLLPIIANVAFAWHMYKSQWSLYETHLAAGGKKASILVPLVLPVVFLMGIGTVTFLIGIVVDRANL